MSTGVADKVDFCITTFKRPEAVAQLLRSIAPRYPDAAIYVGDQGEVLDENLYDGLAEELSAAGLVTAPDVRLLPFDCGLSAARNHLVTTTPREYKLILDDDFAFTDDTRIERFLRLLDTHPEAGIVGGNVHRDGEAELFDFRIDRTAGTTFRPIVDDSPYSVRDGVRYRETDCVVNFALIRRDLFDHVLWDPELKVGEHGDFFFRMLDTPYSVLHTPDVAVDHLHPEEDPDYARYRGRHMDYLAKAMAKHGLTKIERPDGGVIEFPAEADGAGPSVRP
jgi:GT2 family glycosyltransferase